MEAQILVGREIIDGTYNSTDYYQLMVDWRLVDSSNYLSTKGSNIVATFASRSLAHVLNEIGIREYRVYNGVNFDPKTKRFSEMETISPFDEITIRQTLKTWGGVLAA